MQYGFINVAAAVPSVRVADCEYNIQQIESLIAKAEGQGVEIIVFPELSVTGYSCQDLFRQTLLLEQAETAVMMLLDFTRDLDIIAIVGVPVVVGGMLLNCAAVIQKGDLLGLVPKTFLPNYGEFYEKRWFASALDIQPTEVRFAGSKVIVTPQPTLFRTFQGALFGVEICEDLWAPAPPSTNLALAGADIVFNLSASDELTGKHNYLTQLISHQSARTISGYVYSGCGFGESTQDVVYAGNAVICENGRTLAEGRRFSLEPQVITAQVDVEMLRADRRSNSTYSSARHGIVPRVIECHGATAARDFKLERTVNPYPFIPSGGDIDATCAEIFSIQAAGLAKRLVHTGCKTVVVGISGGLDSTLALLVCVKAYDMLQMPRLGILGVTMPGFGTTGRTHANALSLMRNLGVSMREISIKAAVTQHFADIGHDAAVHDATYENSQARERTQVLMDLANQEGGIVIGTGDLSELALGWATYNGDHISMYGVNAGVPKTLVRHLVSYAARELDRASRLTLEDIIATPVSPELIPADDDGNISQKTEDIVGPYALHDFFLYYTLRYGFRPAKTYLLARRAFSGEGGAPQFADDEIKRWLAVFMRRFFAQQFKRSCLPDGPKVGSVSLSPRGDWRMPSDASAAAWLKECERL